MSVYETSPVQQPMDESETTITVVLPSATYTFRLVAVAQVPTEGRGLQEMGPSNPSELVIGSF